MAERRPGRANKDFRSSQPHVAFVLQELAIGGSGRIVSMVSSHLVQQGWKVTVFAFEDPKTEPYYPHHPQVRLVRLGVKSAKFAKLGGFAEAAISVNLLRKHFKTAEPDLIVSFLPRTNILSVIAARGLNMPVIVSERDKASLQKVSLIWSQLRRWTYPRAHGLVTMSKRAMEHVPRAMCKRYWVIPNPAVLSLETQASRSGGRTITAIGRLVPQKRFDLLIRAFSLIAARHPDWRLVIWGEGPERDKLERQRARHRLEHRISMPGVSVSPGGWLATSDIFVLPSRFEGAGLVLGEAMAAGLPVVSFDCPWASDEIIVHEETGLLETSVNAGALARSLDRLCSNPVLRERLGANARIAMQRFAPEIIAQEWQNVIWSVIPRKVAYATGSSKLPSPA